MAGPEPGGSRYDRDKRSSRAAERRESKPGSGPHARRSSSRLRRPRSGRGLAPEGPFSKLCGGGGEVVYHSSVSPSHGSLPARTPARRLVQTTFTMKTRIAAPIPSAPVGG